MNDLNDLTIVRAREMMDSGEISPEELRRAFIEKIKKEDKDINSYITVFEEADEKEKDRILIDSPLRDVPGAIKDAILIKNKRCTAGSKILDNYVASYNATVVERLKNRGASFLGKTNMDEFAMGASGEYSAYGPTKNPHDHSRVAGGSSSGSAASVASGMAIYSLGSDTGGSIRTPASYSGVVGLKTTYGRVSRHGLIAMASSLDQIGPITKTVEDAAIVLDAISGHDPLDASSSPIEKSDYRAALQKPVTDLTLGVPKEFFSHGLDPDVERCIKKALKEYERMGVAIEEVSLPMTEYALPTYYIIVPSEVSSNLARFDGIRYGLSDRAGDELLDIYRDSRAKGFGDEVRRRIMLGTYTLSAGYYDAYYLKAQKVRTLVKENFDKLFNIYDAIVGPVTPTVAPKIGETSDPVAMYLTDIYTVQANLAGIPALSVPCGMIEKEGKQLPVGFQIMTKHFDEARALQLGYALEQALQ